MCQLASLTFNEKQSSKEVSQLLEEMQRRTEIICSERANQGKDKGDENENEEEDEDEEGASILRGYVYKEGSVNRDLKLRWLQLQPVLLTGSSGGKEDKNEKRTWRLSYYATESDASKGSTKAKGHVETLSFSFVKMATPREGKAFALEISTPLRIWHFGMDDPNDVEMWCVCFCFVFFSFLSLSFFVFPCSG